MAVAMGDCERSTGGKTVGSRPIVAAVHFMNPAHMIERPLLVDWLAQHVSRADGGGSSPDECRDAAEGRHPLSRGSM